MSQKKDDRPEELLRLPGLFRRWEFEQVIDGSDEFRVEAAGRAADGTELFAVYRREEPRGTGERS